MNDTARPVNTKRLASIDAYRGLVMLLMMAEVLRIPDVAEAFPRSGFWQLLAFRLVGFWAASALYPLPGPAFNYVRVGVPADWSHHAAGFAAHWNKNSNLGSAFDQWFLNLFPRSKPFVANEGGYLTLSFIPTLGTMLLGLIAGGWLRSPLAPKQRVQR